MVYNDKDDLISSAIFRDSLSHIINFSIKNVEDFVNLVLQELIVMSSGSEGFISANQTPSDHNLISGPRIVNNSFSEGMISDQTGSFGSGVWIETLNRKNSFILNEPVRLHLVTDSENEYKNVKRICSLPLIINNYLIGVFTVVNKPSDYTSHDINILESVMAIAARLLEDFLKSEELKKAKKEAEENVKRKNTYLNNISHEIKTPVNAIIGFCSLMKEHDQSDLNRKKFLDIILESSNNLVSILSSVTEISNFESGLINIVEKEMNIIDLISDVAKPFHEEASRRLLHLKTDLNISGNDAVILADRSKLTHILSNLLSNSFKFTYTGVISVTCLVKNNFIEVIVSDTGSGISEENKPLVFNHFFQAGDSLLKTYKGNGLGLSTSKIYVERMGGKMWFNSTEGKGSEFCFTVPYKPVISQPLEELTMIPKFKNHLPQKKVILVAEDDHLNFSLIHNFLLRRDVKIMRAENGREAVELCNSNKIDLVLMDIRMPVMDGYTATRIIKESYPDLIVIAQTAYTNDRDTALSNGCNDFIAKPFSKNQLLALVDVYL